MPMSVTIVISNSSPISFQNENPLPIVATYRYLPDNTYRAYHVREPKGSKEGHSENKRMRPALLYDPETRAIPLAAITSRIRRPHSEHPRLSDVPIASLQLRRQNRHRLSRVAAGVPRPVGANDDVVDRHSTTKPLQSSQPNDLNIMKLALYDDALRGGERHRRCGRAGRRRPARPAAARTNVIDQLERIHSLDKWHLIHLLSSKPSSIAVAENDKRYFRRWSDGKRPRRTRARLALGRAARRHGSVTSARPGAGRGSAGAGRRPALLHPLRAISAGR
ncbi:hypothetical protein EVAR_7710_1 [Eumeta japonica]|uniref:Uncharacterized protein n=1 Tax=Eumeta variegata TaxID=151549 RepID=A0A4C1TIE7_EUMVA|nr:hypothetical protein EVAR_7710_1 [Eumeta japonica]